MLLSSVNLLGGVMETEWFNDVFQVWIKYELEGSSPLGSVVTSFAQTLDLARNMHEVRL